MVDYAVSSWIAADASREEAIALIADAGFRAVELAGGVSDLMLGWEADAAGVREELGAAGIVVPSVHCPRVGRTLDAEDDADVQDFEWMRECGIPEIVIHALGGVDVSTDSKRRAARKRSIESLKALAGPAGDMGVRMAVQNLGRPSGFGSPMADLIDMIDGLGDHVGFCHDVGHLEQAQLDVLGELKTVAMIVFTAASFPAASARLNFGAARPRIPSSICSRRPAPVCTVGRCDRGERTNGR